MIAEVASARSNQFELIGAQHSVSRTFIVLVTPVLNLIGWRLRHPEYWFIPDSGSDADARMVHAFSAEHSPNQTHAVVETRALGADIREGIEFHLDRCRSIGVAVFAITDGRFWRIYPIGVHGVDPDSPAAICDLFSGDERTVEAMTMLKSARPQFQQSQLQPKEEINDGTAGL